jgi:hypothetical protein
MHNLNRLVSRSLAAALVSGSALAVTATMSRVEAQSNTSGNAAPRTQPKKFVSPPNIKGLHFSQDIPINFPVPQYTSNVLKKAFLNTTKGTPRASVTIQTKDRCATVAQWYTDFFKKDKWTLKVPTPQAQAKLSTNGELYMMQASKDKNSVQVVCTPKKDKTATNVFINWELNKPAS